MPKQKIQRRKTADQRKENFLRVRLDDRLDAAIRKLAESDHITVSAWATQALVNAVRAKGIQI